MRLLASVFPLLLALGLSTLHAAENPAPVPTAEYVTAVREAVRAFNAREFDAVMRAIDRAEKMQPPNPLTLNTRGAALIELRRFDEGAEYCRKALALDPKFYPARFNLCEIPLVQRRYAEARAMFQKLLEENPKDELAQFRVLLTYLLEKNDAEARKVLDALPFPSNTPAYYYGNAAWEFAHGNSTEANKWITRGNWVFKPELTAPFSQPFIEVGWLKSPPPVSSALPDSVNASDIPSSVIEIPKRRPEAPK